MAKTKCWICGNNGPVKPTQTLIPGVKKPTCVKGNGCNK
jgi:hypothetical protein